MRLAKLLPYVDKICARVNSGKIFIRYSSGATESECGKKIGVQGKEKQDAGPGEGNGEGNKSSLVLGVYQSGDKFELTAAAAEIDQKSGGKLSRHLNEMSSQLSLGKALVVTDVVPQHGAVALSSLGPKDPGYNTLEDLDETRENVRVMVGAGVNALRGRGSSAVAVDGAAAAGAAAEAAHLAAWRFEEFKSDRQPTPRLSLYGPEGQQAWAEGSILGRAQNWARFLSDMPANKMTPVDLAQAALDVLCPLGVRVAAHEHSWVAAQGMAAFLAVARGSCEPPLFLQCEYRGAADAAPVLIAAKGITFDSGGLCLKPRAQLQEMRGSMAGAAVTLAALRALAELKVAINVVAVIPLCENMVSGQCMKVGDVVRALNGLSLQIEDTDLEGRLALADALVYGQAQFKPALVIDVATLTLSTAKASHQSHTSPPGGVLLGTGGGAFGCFSNSEGAWAALRRAGAATGDRAWRFPLWDYYQRQIRNDPAVDLRNKGSGTATPCIGAAFLKNFICGDWLHLDMTGVGRVAPEAGAAPTYLAPRRMSGRPTRTLVAFLAAAAGQGGGEPGQ
ncbi:cytosol aminopeptidase-like [Pararge aegeria]|uniref:cytosol aminopeptidase-like n=1 Tax=Pararge aegeria TaxID=116150 RepID=UPI0019D08A81|nr:cytosol aminopeptidase-like [Pararge aegeria]